MATIAINYREMGNAAGDAAKVSKKLTAYADSINNTVLNKLNSYSGERTGNISSAVNNSRNKKNQLEEDSRRYSDYSNNLKNLEDDCKNTDKRVADRVKSLTGTFKDCYGIKTNAILDGFNSFMTSLANSNPVFRWIGNNIVDRAREGRDYLKSKIKEWYNYEGGKQLIIGAGVAVLTIVVAVVGIVTGVAPFIAAVIAGTATVWGAITAAAAVVGGLIGIFNGITNLVNEGIGYGERQNGNASMGYRRSKLDTLTDTVRTFSDDKGIHILANIVDGIEFVCDVINFLDSAKDLIKNGYKWTTGKLDQLNDLKLKDILTKSNIKDFGIKLKTDLLEGGRAIKAAFARKDWAFFKNVGKNIVTDFAASFKERYWNFGDWKDSMESIGNIASFGKELLDADGFWGKSGAVLTEMVLPCINIAQNATGKTDGHGNFIWNNNRIVLDDPEKVSISDIAENVKDMFETSFQKLPELIGKFTGVKGPNITIPKIYVPRIDIQININIQPISIPSGLAA